MLDDIDARPRFWRFLDPSLNVITRLTVDFSVKVGVGGHSDVYRGIMDPTGAAQPVAVKKYRFTQKAFDRDKSVNERIKAEIDIWGRLEHPNILRLYGLHFADEPNSLPNVVSPWCDGGTMLDHLRSARVGCTPRSPNIFEALALFHTEVDLLLQVTSGLAYLHRKDIIHGDVKGVNILIHDGVALLSDFGYSVMSTRDIRHHTSAHLGTQRWYAPEAIAPKAHRSKEADIWALGCVIMEAYTLQEPYSGVSDVNMFISLHDGDTLPYTYADGMNQSLWDLATECWSRMPADRPNAGAVETGLRRLTTIIEVSSAVTVYLQRESSSSISLPSSMLPLSSIVPESQQDMDPFATVQKFTVALGYRTQGQNCTGTLDSTVVRPIARAVATMDPMLAERLMANFCNPRVAPSITLEGRLFSRVVFLPDSRRLVSSSFDRGLDIWDIKTGATAISRLEGRTDNVRCVAIHGSRIASCSRDGILRVWHADSGLLILGPLTAHSGKEVVWIEYSRDGTHIGTAGNDHRVAICDANTGVQLREMVGHTAPVTCVAFSEDGTRLVSGSMDDTVRIWDVASGECVGEPYTGHTDCITSVCFCPDDKRIFSSSDDCTIRVWDVETRVLVIKPLQMDGGVRCMALSPDGKRLMSGSMTGRTTMWDVETGAAIPTPFEEHEGWVWSVAYSPDGRTIASASADETIGLWDATDDWKRYEWSDGVKRLRDTLQSDPQALTREDLAALSSLTRSKYGRETLSSFPAVAGLPNPRPVALRLLASLSVQLAQGCSATKHLPSAVDAARAVMATIEALDLRLRPQDLKPVARAFAPHDRNLADELMEKLSSSELGSPLRGHSAPVDSVAFLPYGRRLVSGSKDMTLRIWDIETGVTAIGPLKEHTDLVRCVAVHGPRIASCSWDGTFRVWDADSGKLVLGPITAALRWIAYSRDGARIATGGYNDRTTIWDANTGVQLHEMVGYILCVAFSQDGKRLVCGSGDKTVRIWDVTSGECIGEPLTGHKYSVTAVCFSPDDKRIFSSSTDGTIRIWDAETRALIVKPLRMDDQVRSMALSPDGKRLVSGSQTGKIALWDAETGVYIPNGFKDHEGPVWSVAFSPDGRKIASASDDKTIAFWDATDDWKQWDIEDEYVEKGDD